MPLLLLLLLSWGRAWADDYWSLGLGRASPLAEEGFSQAVGPGVALGLEYIHQFSWVIGLGAQADYLPFKAKTVGFTAPSGGLGLVTRSAKAYSLAGVVRVTPFYEEQLGPYFLGGFGFNSFSFSQSARPQTGFVWADTGTTETRYAKATSMGAAWLLGFGFEKVLTPNGVTAGLEARWHFLAVDKSQFGVEWAKAFTIMARFGVRFAG